MTINACPSYSGRPGIGNAITASASAVTALVCLDAMPASQSATARLTLWHRIVFRGGRLRLGPFKVVTGRDRIEESEEFLAKQ